MAVRESDLLPALHSGAKYVFEYGYVVRDNVNSEHAMAHRWVTPAKTIANNGIRWSITPTSFELGPAINAWVDPEHPERDSMNQRLTTVDGHVRIAVRTTILDGGRYRYDYAVMNEDFVRSTTTGQEPNLRIIASVGIDEIAIPVVRDGELSDLNSTGAGSPWTATTDNAVLAWRAQVGTSLEWGNMHTFSFTSSKKPQPGTILLRVAGTDNPSSYEVKTLTPSG